ncbi:unnamed protein product [Eruca vesicaria subsp. sativa]|uniref:Uncharacterized protein n=1 Tax=Eruca vesicaria subsp. sativa TaxID=29727 RepID=A0ABC8KJ02_ERUVS|nr:unnamed protein product [Eruca vesicaria subsp. sativa]
MKLSEIISKAEDLGSFYFSVFFRWLKDPSRDNNVSLIVRLIFQAVVYVIWKERNQMLHLSVEKPPGIIIEEIKQVIRLRLDQVARIQAVL